MAFAVVIHEKGGQPRRQEFYKSEVTVGRVQGNDIVLPKQNVSKRHSRVVLKNGKFVITDLKSTNGTYVNGRKISSPSVIKETDKIYIGDFVLSTELIDGADEAAAMGAAPPPPPPRAPFASGTMPAQTIASNMSPFAATHTEGGEDYAKTSGALPLPNQGSPAPESPFSAATSLSPEPPAPPPAVATPAPPTPAPAVAAPVAPAPPAAPVMAPPPPAAPATPAPVVAAPATPAPVVAAPATPAPVVAAPATPAPVVATPATPAPVVAPAAPSSPVSSLLPPATRASVAPQPSVAAPVDLSVFDGEESTGVLALHQELMSGLAERSIALPNRYRPGQQLNPELLSAVSEIVSKAAQGQSDDEINQVIDEALSVGRLHNLIEDPEVSSIFLNGAYELVCQRADGKRSVLHNPFSSVRQARVAAARIMNGMGSSEGGAQTQAEGAFGDWRAFVDLNGVTGPNLCLQRAPQRAQLDEWVSEGRADAQSASTLVSCLSAGGAVAIASSDVQSQALLLNALLGSSMSGRRVVSCGVSQSLSMDAAWLTIPSDMDALMNVGQLAPEALVVGDVAGFDGALVLEAISSASSGVALVTARSAQGALAKLRRRALDPSLVSEAIDYVAFVTVGDRGPVLTEVLSVAQAG